MIEEWIVIPGYEGYYEVSNLGNVRSLNRVVIRSDGRSKSVVGKNMKSFTSNNGYVKIHLLKNSVQKSHYVHRLVLNSFLNNIKSNELTVNHKDGIKTNNSIFNLEWATQKENNIHAVKTGLTTWTKLNEEKVREIRELYKDGEFSQRALAKKFNVSQRLILFVLNGGAWDHVK